jgi:hypothetical protein
MFPPIASGAFPSGGFEPSSWPDFNSPAFFLLAVRGLETMTARPVFTSKPWNRTLAKRWAASNRHNLPKEREMSGHLI